MPYVNRGSVMAVGVTFVATSVIAVAMRFAIRLRQRADIGPDDWLSLAAMAFVVAASCIFIVGSATNSLGTHSPDIGLTIFTYVSAQQQLLKKLEFAFYALLVPALTLLKLSILFFYRRIFKISRGFNMCFWILSVLSVAWGLSFFVAWAAQCKHFDDRIYNLETLTTKCNNSFIMLVCQAVFDVLVDLGILVLPIPLVLRLNMSVSRKIAVLGVLLIGSLAIGCGIARMIIVGMILGTPLLSVPEIAGYSTTDFNGLVSLMMFWGMLELGVAMIASCLPTMRPLFQGATVQHVVSSLKSLISLPGTSRSGRSTTRGSRDEKGSMDSSEGIKKQLDYSVTSSIAEGSTLERGQVMV